MKFDKELRLRIIGVVATAIILVALIIVGQRFSEMRSYSGSSKVKTIRDNGDIMTVETIQKDGKITTIVNGKTVENDWKVIDLEEDNE